MQQETKRFKLTGLTELLGSLPASRALHTQFIAAKAPDMTGAEDETDLIQLEEKGVTVFARRPDDDALILLDYQVKGHLKEAVNVLKKDNGVAAARKKIDNYVFVTPRYIPITRDGAALLEEDEMFERPLRGQTPQGERVSLVSSEMIEDPWELDIEITLITNEGTAKSKAITWNTIYEALDYGRLKGLGQFRNGGYGRFTWTELE